MAHYESQPSLRRMYGSIETPAPTPASDNWQGQDPEATNFDDMDSLNDSDSSSEPQLHNHSTTPLWKHDNVCVRLPALLWQFFIRPNGTLFVSWFAVLACRIWALDSRSIVTFNTIILVPLSHVLGLAADSLSQSTSQSMAKLINAGIGNSIVTIIGVTSVLQDESSLGLDILLGSIVFSSLAIYGASALVAGYRWRESRSPDLKLSATYLMAIASLALTTLFFFDIFADHPGEITLLLSDATSLVMLALYAVSLYFRVWTHVDMVHGAHTLYLEQDTSTAELHDVHHYTPMFAFFTILTVLPAAYLCSLGIIGHLRNVASLVEMPIAFLAFIAVPMGANMTDLVVACFRAWEETSDAVLITMESQIQIAFFSLPIMVVFGWSSNHHTTLLARSMDVVAFDLSVVVSNYILGDGRSNYFKGAQCLGMYAIIALTFLSIPNDI